MSTTIAATGMICGKEDAVITLDSPNAFQPRVADIDAGQERAFRTWDGSELFYRAWMPAGPATRALFLFHRGHEHSGRFAEMAEELAMDGVAIFAWDQRGHGRSPGERGYANNFADIIRDIDCFVRSVCRENEIPIQNVIVLGHSVAAVAVAAWVHDYAPPIRALVLATPAFRVKLYVPFAVSGLRAMSLVRKKAFIKSYVKAGMLTHDPEQAKAYAADPLISRQIAVNILLDLYDTSTRLLADAGAIEVPTLILSAGSDWVVKNAPQKAFFDGLTSPVKRLISLDGFNHAIFHEKERERPIGAVRDFMHEQFESEPSTDQSHLLRADTQGFTKREYDTLALPLSAMSPRGLSFAGQRLFLHTLGRLSRGIRVGWNTGFDSGRSLDYVYEKRPRGITPLGKLIDWVYLNAVGWRGVRQRKLDLQTLLLQAIAKIRTDGRAVRIVDVAAGPGRYMLDALRTIDNSDVAALLRDHNPEPLEVGRTLAREMGLSNVTYETGDAFSTPSLASLEPRPNIAVVSGLFELFPDNTKVLASLTGLAQAMQQGGYLIYTNQPWHPQVEMIARVLRNRIGQPWIMRRRTQAEMDALVHSVGFEKLEMLIDPAGIFTVSIARIGPSVSAGKVLQ